MKSKAHSQQNSDNLPKFFRVDDEIEVLVNHPGSIKMEGGAGSKCKELLPPVYVKKENKCVPGLVKCADSCRGISLHSPQRFYTSTPLVPKRQSSRSKAVPIMKNESSEHKKSGDMSQPTKKFKKCSVNCSVIPSSYNGSSTDDSQSSGSNSQPSGCLPCSSGKHFDPVLTQEMLPSFEEKKSVGNSISRNISSKHCNTGLPRSVSKDEPACGSAFYNSQTNKLEVNEADTPPFTPCEEIGCSDVADINTSAQATYLEHNSVSLPSDSRVVRRKNSICERVFKQNSSTVGKIKKAVTSHPPNSPQSSKKSISKREIDELYKSLQEISWAQDREFTTLLVTKNSVRHSGRISSIKTATADRSKKLAKLNQKVPSVNTLKKKSATKNQTTVLKPKPKNAVSSLAKKKLQKSAKIALAKQAALAAPQVKKPLRKPVVRTRIKGSRSVPKAKQNVCRTNTVVRSRNKVVNDQKSVVASVGGRKNEKLSQNFRFKSKNEHKKLNNRTRLESSVQEVSTWQNILKESHDGSSSGILSTLQKGQELRVTIQPLEKTDLWLSEFEPEVNVEKECEAYTRRSLQQSMLKVFAGIDQRHISSVLREVHDSRPTTPSSSKNTRKRKHDEECVRSSVRQSECAFRYKEIVVKKHEHYIQVVLVPNSNKQNSLTIEAMKELKEAFQSARKDVNCKAVLLNSSGSFFCSGIDLGQLCGTNRKHIAEEMAITVRDLILTLAIFPKPIVAAVNGCSVGLGVSLLTFCDIVLASDKATFSIPSAKFGYIPEGGVTLTLPQVVGSTVALEMLLQGRRLTAEQALKYGLVSEVIWPTKLMEEVVPRIQALVKHPLQVMEATKTMVRCHLWEKLAVQLNHEWRLLPGQWLSSVCQQNMKRHLQNGWQFD